MSNTHISAGAVVARRINSQDQILLLYRKSTDTWHLPKGTQQGGETLEQTALREVREETGVTVQIQKYLGELNTVKIDGTPKVTHFFLARPLIVKLEEHDHEHDEVMFISLKEALDKLKNKSDRHNDYMILEKVL